MFAVPCTGIRPVVTFPVQAPRSSPTTKNREGPAEVASSTSTLGNGVGVKQGPARASAGSQIPRAAIAKMRRAFIALLLDGGASAALRLPGDTVHYGPHGAEPEGGRPAGGDGATEPQASAPVGGRPRGSGTADGPHASDPNG